MQQFQSRGQAALYLWDFFYLKFAPQPGEEKPWRRIECATERIRDSEAYLDADYPSRLRLKSAQRVRRAVREVTRLIAESLVTTPPDWVGDVLAHLLLVADEVIAELNDTELSADLH